MAAEGEGASGGSVVVIGGGFSGAVFSLKLALARPDLDVTVVERGRRVGVGLAYGACASHHLLNVPVSRMEVGLTPGFETWLADEIARDPALADALDGPAPDGFAPRALFGRYLETQLTAARKAGALRIVRGEAVRMGDPPGRGVMLEDGRTLTADVVVLATGNAPPGRAPLREPWPADHPAYVPDPWAPGALDGIEPDDAVLMIGAGLTMVDQALALQAAGHRGSILALSRHGRLPTRHQAGGAWAPFLGRALPASPAALMRVFRREVAAAQSTGVPWQRVLDAARPDLARVWRSWDAPARRRFVRHLRARWDVHRHRMAPRVADAVDALQAAGRLKVRAGRIAGCRESADGRLAVDVAPRGAGPVETIAVGSVINCTGPKSDYATAETPLYADLRRGGLIRADALRLGIETDDGAVVGAAGSASSWLFALGPLTRPALWEVTAVPEINAQIDGLVRRLSSATLPHGTGRDGVAAPALADAFADLGAGI